MSQSKKGKKKFVVPKDMWEWPILEGAQTVEYFPFVKKIKRKKKMLTPPDFFLIFFSMSNLSNFC